MRPFQKGFKKLSQEEKLEFVKETVMPAMCEMFSENPQQMMQELKPKCKELMQEKDFNMSQMMNMMGMDISDMMGMESMN